jgi:phosphoribosylaminoimidazole-succinocarboxamide synthase
VRDSFRVDAKTRLIVVTDRISAFDLKLDTPIPGKGEVLNRLAAWWFAQTADIVPNHLLRTVGRQASLLAFSDVFRVVGLLFLLAMPLVLLTGGRARSDAGGGH